MLVSSCQKDQLVLILHDLDADAIIKGFATAIATAILLYLSPLLFGTPRWSSSLLLGYIWGPLLRSLL